MLTASPLDAGSEHLLLGLARERGGTSPVSVTVTVEYPDGRLTAVRFTQAADAIAHLAKVWMRPT